MSLCSAYVEVRNLDTGQTEDVNCSLREGHEEAHQGAYWWGRTEPEECDCPEPCGGEAETNSVPVRSDHNEWAD